MKILILNGPNINLLGMREPEIYGRESYDELLRRIQIRADSLGMELEFFQSNHEGALVDAIQKAWYDKIDGIVFNPAAYTHTSIAIADALKAVSIPTVEVHISDVEQREAYRQVSYVRELAIKSVSGKGLAGYEMALDCLKEYLETGKK